MMKWLPGVCNHMYWCVASSKGNGDLCKAKYRSITNHLSRVHKHTDPLFPKCDHEDNLERDYLKPGEQNVWITQKLLVIPLRFHSSSLAYTTVCLIYDVLKYARSHTGKKPYEC